MFTHYANVVTVPTSPEKKSAQSSFSVQILFCKLDTLMPSYT